MTELYYPYYTRKIARNAAKRLMQAQRVPNVNKHMADDTDQGKFWKEILKGSEITKFNSKKNRKRRHKR